MEWENNHTTLHLANGEEFCFAKPGAGRKNSLLVDTVELFGLYHAPGALLLHLCDPANTIMIHESIQLARIGVPGLPTALLPDIMLYQLRKHYLFLIGVSTLSGTMSTPRKAALEEQMVGIPSRRIYISAFFDREDYACHASEIAWHSYVWLAHDPNRLIIHW